MSQTQTFPVHFRPNGLIHGRRFPTACRYFGDNLAVLTNWFGRGILFAESHLADINSRVDVAVMVGTTGGTGPLAIPQGQGSIQRSAVRTHLARRFKPTDYSEVLTIPAAFVFKHLPKRSPSYVLNRPIQGAAPFGACQHIRDAKVFYTQGCGLVFAHKMVTEFVKTVSADVGNMFMNACDGVTRMFATIAPFRGAAPSSLSDTQAAQVAFEVARVAESLSLRSDNDVLESEVESDGMLFVSNRRNRFQIGRFNQNRGVVFAGVRLGDGGSLNFALKPAREVAFDAFREFTYKQTPRIEIDFIPLMVLKGIPFALTLKTGEPLLVSEESGVGLIQIHQSAAKCLS